MGRRLVVGDIHGGYKALTQVLERANFDPNDDLLISLGDICDGWPQVKECVEFFLGLAQYRFVLGNHDAWFVDYIKTGNAPPVWTQQGGAETLRSYKDGVPERHRRFFLDAPPYLEIDGDLFVHGGFDSRRLLAFQPTDSLIWDRKLINVAKELERLEMHAKFGPYQRVFVGHTTLTNWGLTAPTLFAGSLWGLDTGGGWEGKLSVLDIDSCEFWQSDTVADLYPGEHGRAARFKTLAS